MSLPLSVYNLQKNKIIFLKKIVRNDVLSDMKVLKAEEVFKIPREVTFYKSFGH